MGGGSHKRFTTHHALTGGKRRNGGGCKEVYSIFVQAEERRSEHKEALARGEQLEN